MKLPLKWLKDYVDYNVTHKEFALKMLLRGFEVADIIPEMKVSNVVVCTITHIEQHPNAERLRVCNIDIGAENELVIVNLQIYIRSFSLYPETNVWINSGKIIRCIKNIIP